jgi:hypothetical protein
MVSNTKTLVVSLVTTKRHTNLHVYDISTQRSVTIRDAGVIPSFQWLIDYIRKNSEVEKKSLNYLSYKGRMQKWDFTRYRVFISNIDLLNLLPSYCFGEVKKVAELCK